MTQLAAVKQSPVDTLEQVLLTGDLKALKPEERIMYYKQTCESLGLNPLTKPFEYITLNGKLTLYARKDATDQLRRVNNVSIEKPDIQQIDDLIIVTVSARCADGRVDSDIGVVKKTDMGGSVANALMKAVTKAKRRVTLSICGLGMLDETEAETIPQARPATKGELVEAAAAEVAETNDNIAKVQDLLKQLNAAKDEVKWTPTMIKQYAADLFGLEVLNGLDELTAEQWQFLAEDLTERLDALR